MKKYLPPILEQISLSPTVSVLVASTSLIPITPFDPGFAPSYSDVLDCDEYDY